MASTDTYLANLQTIAQQESQLQYMRHSARSRDSEIEALTARWREFQDMQERWTSYERERVGERDALRKRGEQLEALKNKVGGWRVGLGGLAALCNLELKAHDKHYVRQALTCTNGWGMLRKRGAAGGTEGQIDQLASCSSWGTWGRRRGLAKKGSRGKRLSTRRMLQCLAEGCS